MSRAERKRTEREAAKKENEAVYNVKHSELQVMVENAIAIRVQESATRVGLNTMLVLLEVLHDEYGFRKKRLQRVYERMRFKFSAIHEGYATYDEIEKWMREIAGLDLNVEGSLPKEMRGESNE